MEYKESLSPEEKSVDKTGAINLDNDDTLARVLTLVYAETLIGKYCNGDEDCIEKKNSCLQTYMKSRYNDMRYYVDEIKKSKEPISIDDYFLSGDSGDNL